MNASKFLASTAAAITVVGTIGFVYAQTSPSNPTGATTSPQTQGQITPPGQPTPTNPSMQNPRPSGATGVQSQTTLPGERAPNDPTLQSQRQRGAAGSMNAGSTGGMNRGSTATTGSGTSSSPSPEPGSMSNERVARADRN
jgi:hypothetical protein